MSTPGSFTLASKGTNQQVPPAGTADGGTLLIFKDPETGITTDRFSFPTQDTDFQLQLQAVFSSDIPKRPTWVQIELVRITKSGSTTVYDSTGKSRRAIVQPGTTTWADIFTVLEYVNEDDGMFGWTVTHNAPVGTTIKIEVNIWKSHNPKANEIHKLGGYNMWSDGTIH